MLANTFFWIYIMRFCSGWIFGFLSTDYQCKPEAENKEVVKFALPSAKGGSEK